MAPRTPSLWSRVKDKLKGPLQLVGDVIVGLFAGTAILILYIYLDRHLALPFMKRLWSTSLQRYRVRYQKLPPSKPILSELNQPSTAESTVTNFHSLPAEIQQIIFAFILPPRLILQPELDGSRLRCRIGTYNKAWTQPIKKRGKKNHKTEDQKNKIIRSDSDLPSDIFRHILFSGGWYLNQSALSLGCGTTDKKRKELICGFADPVTLPGSYLDLLLVSRRYYSDVLDDLYGRHVLSFFGVEMLGLFVRNVAPEGLGRVRYVHLGFSMPKRGGRGHQGAGREIAKGIKTMGSVFTRLEMVDVEIVLRWDEGSDNAEFLGWVEEAFGVLSGLEGFTLKVSLLQTEVVMHVAGDHTRGVLRSMDLDGPEYKRLKRRVLKST